jgi:hypothetical protein
MELVSLMKGTEVSTIHCLHGPYPSLKKGVEVDEKYRCMKYVKYLLQTSGGSGEMSIHQSVHPLTKKLIAINVFVTHGKQFECGKGILGEITRKSIFLI